jgi:hypothetical protein
LKVGQIGLVYRYSWAEFFIVTAIVDPAQGQILGKQFELRGVVRQQRFDDWEIGLLLVVSDSAGFGKVRTLANAQGVDGG